MPAHSNPINRQSFFTGGKNVLLVFLGTVILAFGTAIFILPFHLVVGGISGLSLLIEDLLPEGFLSLEEIIAILNWFFFLLGLVFLGGRFALKTFLSALVYPAFIAIFLQLTHPDALGGIFYLKGSAHPELALMLAATVGGGIVGAGCALTLMGGGSTGGIDVIAFLVCKAFPRVRHAHVLFVIDTAIILGGIFTLGDLTLSLLGVLSAFFTALVLDLLLSWREASANARSESGNS